MVSTFIYLQIKLYLFDSDIKDAAIEMVRLEDATKKMQTQVDFIKKEAIQAKDIHTNNQLLSDSIKNLFDIVPDKITLSKALLDKNSLILYGKTPSKEVYQFMLLAPLRSIFDRSYTSFYQLENGWYNFESTNYIDIPEQEMSNE